MTRHIFLVPMAMVLISACNAAGGDPSMDDAMRRDLEAVQAGTMLAPVGEGQKVVSAIEQTGKTQPRPTAPKPKAPPSASEVAQHDEPAPLPEPLVTQTAPVSGPAATRPTSTPRVSPPPPGGYKTVGEVIRNAPFPIKPATKPGG